jgi:hypothetical protein
MLSAITCVPREVTLSPLEAALNAAFRDIYFALIVLYLLFLETFHQQSELLLHLKNKRAEFELEK